MVSYILGVTIGGISLLVIVAGLWLGANHFTNNQQYTETEQVNSHNKQDQNVVQSPTYRLTVKQSPPVFTFSLHVPPIMPIPPSIPIPPYKATDKEWQEYTIKKAKYDEAWQEYLIKKAKYDDSIKNYTVSSVTTVHYGGMTLSTDKLELKIHELINNERVKYGFNRLSYDYKISNIARSHSSDMSQNNFFDHTNLKGKGPHDRGYVYDYYDCGDKSTIQLIQEYDRLAEQFKATGNTDVVLHNKLESMRIKLNSAIEQEMVFDGLSENIFQNNLYAQYWTTDGVITSYDWSTLDEIAQTTVEGWMNSTGHRENILTPYYSTEGIGVSINSKDYKVYITQNFC